MFILPVLSNGTDNVFRRKRYLWLAYLCKFYVVTCEKTIKKDLWMNCWRCCQSSILNLNNLAKFSQSIFLCVHCNFLKIFQFLAEDIFVCEKFCFRIIFVFWRVSWDIFLMYLMHKSSQQGPLAGIKHKNSGQGSHWGIKLFFRSY
jgi:hypothetical protein